MQISIILPVFSETLSLNQTVEEIIRVTPAAYLKEILIIVSPKSTKESLEICKNLSASHAYVQCYIQQNNPGIGWAFREAFEKVQGTHTLMMASDGETDPKAIPLMINKAEATGCAIVTANRWMDGGGFEGYNFFKKILNYCFQKIIKAMYIDTIDDYSYAYRLYKTESLKGHTWQETRHPFLLEALLRPLKRGATIEQVPVMWHSRTQGKSQNTLLQNFMYFRTAFKVYFEKQK